MGEWTEGRELTCRERDILADFLKEVMATTWESDRAVGEGQR